MIFRILISVYLSLPLLQATTAFAASPCDENLVSPGTPNVDVASLPWVDFPKEFPIKARDLDALFEAAYGDHSMSPENYILLTQGEFNRMIRALKEGGLGKFNLAAVDPGQTSQLRRVPGFLLVPSLAGVKQKKIDLQDTLRSLIDFFRYARNNGLLFEQNISPSHLAANPLFTRATQLMLNRVSNLTASKLRFRLNPFEELRPANLGQQLKDLLAKNVGALGHYMVFPNLIEFNLYMYSHFIRMQRDHAWFWSELNDIILHEGDHAISNAAGMDYIRIANMVRPIAAKDAAGMEGLDTPEFIIEQTRPFIPWILSRARDLPESEQATYTAKVIQELLGNSLTAEQFTTLTAKVSYSPAAEDLEPLFKDMSSVQKRAFYMSLTYLYVFVDTFDELMAHEAGGQTFTGAGYRTLPFITAFVKEQVLPNRKSYFRKPELIR